MIRSFAHKGLERFFVTGSTAGIQAKHAQKLRFLLSQLNDAMTIEDMRLPMCDLHPLKGSLQGYWAVKVNGNWRIIFRFEDGDAHVVNYVDYH